jgi:hypothetical protein
MAEDKVRTDYGFLPDLQSSVRQNAQRVLGDTPPGFYFFSPSNLAFHDLTPGRSLPPATRTVMGLSSKFIPIRKTATTKKKAMESFERFERDLSWKVYFSGSDDDFIKTKMYVKSKTRPPLPPPYISSRITTFEKAIRKLFGHHPRMRTNFTAFQERLFERLRKEGNIVFATADKGLGPVAVALAQYIKDGLVHLQDEHTYTVISEEQALQDDVELRTSIRGWMRKHVRVLSTNVRLYLETKLQESSEEPFGYFYLLYKLHKKPVKTRPVCSDCTSTPHALGEWVDEMLQPIVKEQAAYFKDSFSLKKRLEIIAILGYHSLITFDAVSMYTNINTQDCIERLSTYLLDPSTKKRFPHYPPKALVAAIKLVMNNNRMKFGDIFVQQLKGIAMGMSPAPPIANLYVALHEATCILPTFASSLFFYVRFIDDGLAIWKHDSDPIIDARNLEEFKKAINKSGLTWTFTDPSTQVDFMDLTIKIEGKKITTNLFEKPLALHLYIPPHSCHPPSCFGSLVSGMILRFYRLCTYQKDIRHWLKKFYGHLLDRGYQQDRILPLFNKSIENAVYFTSTSDEYRLQIKTKLNETSHKIFFHLKYHPSDPKSSEMQKLWRSSIFQPDGKPALNQLDNYNLERVTVNKLVICYSRHHNIGNLLSYRKICKRKGLKVSSFL